MKLANIKELSVFLKIKESTLYSWVNNGSLPYYKLNGLLRFDMEEIGEWVKRSRQVRHEANKELRRTLKDQNIDSIINKAIDGVTGKRYNSSKGKPGPRQGLRKEVKDGTF